MTELDYAEVIDRIIELLKENEDFNKEIAEFRFGELPEEEFANEYPACYVTTSTKPEISREIAGPAVGTGYMPQEKIVTEFWIVIVTDTALAENTQRNLYRIKNKAIKVFETNTQLRDRQGLDPLCSAMDIYSINRLTSQRGQTVDGVTVALRVYTEKRVSSLITEST